MIHSIMHFILIRVKRGQDSAPVSVCNIGPHKNTCFGRGKIEKRELQRAEQKGSEKNKVKKGTVLRCGVKLSESWNAETLRREKFEEKGDTVIKLWVGGNSNIFYVHPEPWENGSNLTIFSNGLKPPTRTALIFYNSNWQVRHEAELRENGERFPSHLSMPQDLESKPAELR